MKLALATALLLAGCLDDSESAKDQPSSVYLGDVSMLEWTSVEMSAEVEPDLCALATELARDNVCSLLCAPDQFAARLIDGGMDGGRCYQMRCELGQDITVSVGVCIP